MGISALSKGQCDGKREMAFQRENTQEQKRRNKRQSVMICTPASSLAIYHSARAFSWCGGSAPEVTMSLRKTGTFLGPLSRQPCPLLFPPPYLPSQRRETRVVGFVKANATLIYDACLARNRASYPPRRSLRRYDFE